MSLTPTELSAYRSFENYKSVIYVQLGLYMTEYLVTLPFEIKILRKHIPFQWPMAFYFIARYSVWVAMVPNIMLLHSSWKLNCEVLYRVLSAGLVLEVTSAEAIFTVRAWSLWDRDWRITTILAIAWLGHLATALTPFWGTKMVWIPDSVRGGGSCQIAHWHSWQSTSAYSYALFMDVFLVSLVAYKLYRVRSKLQTSVISMLLRDSIAFAIIVAIPTAIAIIVYNIGDTDAFRGSALTFACLMHAILGCRAVMNISDVLEGLPASFKYKVSNGEFLDADTLARMAYLRGPKVGEDGSFKGPRTPSTKSPYAQQQRFNVDGEPAPPVPSFPFPVSTLSSQACQGDWLVGTPKDRPGGTITRGLQPSNSHDNSTERREDEEAGVPSQGHISIEQPQWDDASVSDHSFFKFGYPNLRPIAAPAQAASASPSSISRALTTEGAEVQRAAANRQRYHDDYDDDGDEEGGWANAAPRCDPSSVPILSAVPPPVRSRASTNSLRSVQTASTSTGFFGQHTLV